MNNKLKKLFSKYFKDDEAFEGEDFLYAYGNEVDFLLYKELYHPKIIEIENCIVLDTLLKEKAERERFIAHLEKVGKLKTEESYNFVEVEYLFSDKVRKLEGTEIITLCEVIKESWLVWLFYKYPLRKFEFSIIPPEETGSVWGISFHEIEN